YSGVETCPSWAATGQREDHISGDIAVAAWQYWLMTGDADWLRTVGYPLLEGIADFWVSRSTQDRPAAAYHIKGVIPPDEYVDHVDDSVYTNFVARLALQATIQAAAVLNTTCDRCATYQSVAEGLVLLFDEDLQIHPEYAGYPGNLVKQADVVLLHYPLGLDMPANVQLSDLEYYSSRTDPKGPAMTWGMHCIGYLDLQQFDRAAQFFNMSFQDNMHAPLMVWTETVSRR
ncbi:glycoside hydrolase family 65 protein, partial [archaeon]